MPALYTHNTQTDVVTRIDGNLIILPKENFDPQDPDYISYVNYVTNGGVVMEVTEALQDPETFKLLTPEQVRNLFTDSEHIAILNGDDQCKLFLSKLYTKPAFASNDPKFQFALGYLKDNAYITEERFVEILASITLL